MRQALEGNRYLAIAGTGTFSFTMSGRLTPRQNCIAILAILHYTPSMNTTLSVRVPKTLRERLLAAARQGGVSQGRLICEGLELRLASEPGAGGLMRLAGVMKGPKDLSHNKAYRRQWGRAKP